MKNTFSDKIKPIFFYLWFIVVVSGLMVCLMWAVYSIPVRKIRINTWKSMESLVLSMHYVPYSLDGSVIDSYTDSIMLNNATFLGRYNATLYDAMMNPRVEYMKTPQENLYISLQKVNLMDGIIVDYPRFWHGYLIFLKPLLVFFDLKEIRMLNLFFQAGFLLAVLYLMYKRLGFKYCAAFITATCFVNLATSCMCLEYATDVNIMLLATLWVLLNKNPDDKYMFFVIGAVTILFDFLTFPLITLGIPLIVYICLYERRFKDSVFCVIKNSILWVSGYALMLFSKWSLATLLTGQNIWKEGWNNIAHRTWGVWDADSLDVSAITYHNAVVNSLGQVFQMSGVYYIGCFFLLIIVCYVFQSFRFVKNIKALVVLSIGGMPFVWYGIMINHSVVHPWMAGKILIITIYAILSAIVCCLQPKSKLSVSSS